MPWEPLAEWGPLDSDFDELSPPSNKSLNEFDSFVCLFCYKPKNEE